MRNNAIVQVGRGALAAKFGANLPLALIAGPCQMESRAHALETAQALKEIAARLEVGLVYKTSFDKANRTVRLGRARRGARGGAAGVRRNPRVARPAGDHRRARERPVRPGRRGGRRAADPGLPLPPDRPFGRGGAHRPRGQRQEGAVPRALGHEERGREARRRRRGRRARHRAGVELRLQHAGRRHAGAADHGARDRRARHLRRHPFGAAAGRAGDFIRRAARIRAGAGARGRRGRRRRRLHRDPSRPRPRALRRAQHGARSRTSRRWWPNCRTTTA